MRLRELAALATIAMIAVEIAVPGADVYHAGWYNVLLAALAVVAVARARADFVRAPSERLRAAIAAVAFGAAIAALAGIANGLLAPDNREIVGSPGERLRADELGGTLRFPLVAGVAAGVAPVVFDRGGRSAEIGLRARNLGGFELRSAMRDVVFVQARDASGARVTITQPTGSVFLSPVLLMQQRQTIAGMNLPFDSFAVPAAHRVVKAMLFTAAQAAALRGAAGTGAPAVLFAVDDAEDRPIPHAIALAAGGQTVAVGGLRLRAAVFAYPAVEVVSVPQFGVVLAGALAVAGGLIASRLRNRTAV